MPCSYWEGVGEGLGNESVLSLLTTVRAGLATATVAAAVVKVAYLPACLIRLISVFVGRIISLSLTLGLVGQFL